MKLTNTHDQCHVSQSRQVLLPKSIDCQEVRNRRALYRGRNSSVTKYVSITHAQTYITSPSDVSRWLQALKWEGPGKAQSSQFRCHWLGSRHFEMELHPIHPISAQIGTRVPDHTDYQNIVRMRKTKAEVSRCASRAHSSFSVADE